jgi:twitching motility two-component system response regulator PilH
MPIRTILVVDDSPTERLALMRFLSRHGYQVITANNGEEAVSISQEALPDLILMDVVMPGLNGFQATRAITRESSTQHIPVILCSSKNQDTDRIWGMRQGACDYLVKPADQGALLAKIAALDAAR